MPQVAGQREPDWATDGVSIEDFNSWHRGHLALKFDATGVKMDHSGYGSKPIEYGARVGIR